MSIAPGSLTAEHVDIDTLRPHQQNPRNGDIDTIAESLRVNGQYRPIVIARDGTILAGNHTYMAAMQLKWQRLSVVRLDVDATSDAALKIMLADNRTADLGNYDNGVLASLLTHMADVDSLLGTGYDTKSLTDLLSSIDAPLVDLPDHVGLPTLVVTCSDETEQERLMSEFLERGLNVKGMWT